MIKPESPCKNCENRRIGCHAVCAAYSDFAIRQEKYKRAIRHRNNSIIYSEGQMKKMRKEKR